MDWIFALLMLPFGAFAEPATAPSQTLFIVHRNSGFVAAESSYRLECQIESDSTNRVWAKGRDATINEENKPTVYSQDLPDLDSVRRALEEAARGTMTRSTGPTDRPTSRYYGILEDSVVDRYVKLLINRSVTIDRNDAKVTDALLALADLNCPLP